MKKVLYSITFLFIFIFLTGCGKSYDVECTKTDETAGYKIEYFVGAKIKNNKVKSYTIKLTYPKSKKEEVERMYNFSKVNDDGWKIDGNTLTSTKKVKESVSKKDFIDTNKNLGYKCK